MKNCYGRCDRCVWRDNGGCSEWNGLEVTAMADCKCEFVYDELHGRIVCKKCFRVLTAEEKQELLEHANALQRAEEAQDG